MPPDEPSFFSRDELLGGLPARRASTVLFAIEARTAHLVARSKRAMAWYETPRTSADRERAFLEAIAGGRELPMTPSVQDLERFAPRWAELVPDATDLRASLARLLAQKYALVHDQVPRLRDALGLDDPPVAEAYERLHSQPIGSIYAPTVRLRERLRWARMAIARRLEELPPFWSAYALTLTETVGSGILVLSIAVAPVGPIPGVVFLLVFGALNILTIGGMVEAISRNGEMRYGSTYFGRLAASLLGRGGSVGITLALFALNAVTLLAFLLAFAAQLADATGIHMGVWVAVLFGIDLVFLRRGIDSTVTSAIVIGAVNVGLVAAILAITFPHVRAENLRFARIPFVGDHPADAAALALVFGVALVAYFGHTSAGNVAKVILTREPTGKALFWGNAAAILTVIALYSLVVLAINGSLRPDALIGHPGTALEPLAAEIGPSIRALGSVYVALAVGLGSIYVALGLFNQVRERLPRRPADGLSDARWSALAASERGGFLLCVSPVVLVFLVLEALVLTDHASLTDPLSLMGALALPLLGGVFPMLLLAAARRRGELVPAAGVKVLRGPLAIGAVAVVFFAGLIIQGFVIWQRPVERGAAGLVIVMMAAIVWMAVRAGAFHPRAVVELRRDLSGEGHLNVTIGGQPQAVAGSLALRSGARSDGSRVERFADLQDVSVEVPPDGATDLKVWVHAVTADGESEPIPSVVRVRSGDDRDVREFRLEEGVVIVPMDHGSASVEITPEVPGR